MSPLTKNEARLAATAASSATLDFTARPIWLGLGGCPWRMCVAALVWFNASDEQARIRMAQIFERWPTPEALSRANRLELSLIMAGVNNYHRRVRMVTKLSAAWVREDWVTVMDLPGISRFALYAIDQHVTPLHRAAPVLQAGSCSAVCQSDPAHALPRTPQTHGQ
jgi:hypothetical protein